MPYVSPASPVSGATISKSTFGDVVKADLDYLASPPACRVYNSTNITTTNNVEKVLTFNTERFDTNSMHSTSVNTDRITFAVAGLYLVSLSIEFATNGATFRYAGIRLNGVQFIAYDSWNPANISFGNGRTMTSLWKMNASDYVTAVAWQNTGGNLDVAATSAGNNFHSPEFSAVWVGLGT